MAMIIITTENLDRLVHALLLAKAGYLCQAIDRCDEAGVDSHASWQEAKRNVDALSVLYAQLDAALSLETVEG